MEIYKFKICNNTSDYLENLVLDINIPSEYELLSGSITRERGTLTIEEELKDLTIGNLRDNEEVDVVIRIIKKGDT